MIYLVCFRLFLIRGQQGLTITSGQCSPYAHIYIEYTKLEASTIRALVARYIASRQKYNIRFLFKAFTSTFIITLLELLIYCSFRMDLLAGLWSS